MTRELTTDEIAALVTPEELAALPPGTRVIVKYEGDWPATIAIIDVDSGRAVAGNEPGELADVMLLPRSEFK